ncbi:hypothetical protein ACVGOW_28115 [Pseudonocardia saturnea]
MDELVALALVRDLARRRWRLLTALALVGALLGAGTWWALAPGHVARSEVLLQGARDDSEVAAQTEIATSLVVLDAVAATVGPGVTGVDLRDRVSVTVAEGNVVAITGTGPTPEAAQRLADGVTGEYMRFADRLSDEAATALAAVLDVRRDELGQRIEDTRRQIAGLQSSPALTQDSPEGARARSELDRLGNELTSATTELQDTEGKATEVATEATASRGRITVIEPAAVTGAGSPTLVQLVAGGAIGLALAGLVALLLARSADRRLSAPADVAAALGVPLLADGAVTVAPGDLLPAEARPGDGLVARLLAFLRAGPAPVGRRPLDDGRARRAMVQVADRHTGPVVLLVADGDAGSRPAAARLAAGAGAAIDISVVGFDPTRPVLPEGSPDRAAVAVVGAGMLSGPDLVDLAVACGDAEVSLLGVVVALPVREQAQATGPDVVGAAAAAADAGSTEAETGGAESESESGTAAAVNAKADPGTAADPDSDPGASAVPAAEPESTVSDSAKAETAEVPA